MDGQRAQHVPVMCTRIVELLSVPLRASGSVYVDCTLGLGGHVPALLGQVASGSIHFADFMMLASKHNHARNGRPHLTTSPPREINPVRSSGFARCSVLLKITRRRVL